MISIIVGLLNLICTTAYRTHRKLLSVQAQSIYQRAERKKIVYQIIIRIITIFFHSPALTLSLCCLLGFFFFSYLNFIIQDAHFLHIYIFGISLVVDSVPLSLSLYLAMCACLFCFCHSFLITKNFGDSISHSIFIIFYMIVFGENVHFGAIFF